LPKEERLNWEKQAARNCVVDDVEDSGWSMYCKHATSWLWTFIVLLHNISQFYYVHLYTHPCLFSM
jgi:hypothetical protein